MPNPLENLYTLGLASGPEAVQWTRTLPMVPQHKVNFRPAPASGGLDLDSDWAKMDMAISVLRPSDLESVDEGEDDDEKTGRALRRKYINVDYDTPFCKIRHELKVSLRLSWLPEDAVDEVEASAQRRAGSYAERKRKARSAHPMRKSETLLFTIPVKVVTVPDHVEQAYIRERELACLAAEGASIDRSASPARSQMSACSSSSTAESRPSTPPASVRPSPFSVVASLPSLASSVSTCSSLPRDDLHTPSSFKSASPYKAMPFALPPYSELYHSNGDRREPLTSWLPRYIEKEDVELPDSAASYAAVSVLGLQV
jgi:hypothetical protein